MDNTITTLRKFAEIVRQRELASLPSIRIPSKRRAKADKVACRIDRMKHSPSMLNRKNKHPHPFKRLQGQLDDRTVQLFNAHFRRQGAGWIRG